MSVIPITIFFSLLLVGLFIGLFAHEQWRRRFTSPERESLLPLADERPKVAAAAGAVRTDRAQQTPGPNPPLPH